MAGLSKTNKNPDDFAEQTPDYEVKLELFDRVENHNKFWHCAVYGTYVVRHWGRHGTKGQSSVHMAYSNYAAKEEARKLTSEKRGKGYEPEKSLLDRFARETA